MASRSLLGSAVGLAVGAVTHPIGTTFKVIGTARSAAGATLTLVGNVLEHVAAEPEAPSTASRPASASEPAPAAKEASASKPAPAAQPAVAPEPALAPPAAAVEPPPAPPVAPNTVASDDSLEPEPTIEPDAVTATPGDVAQMVAKKAPATKASPRTAQQVLDGDDREVTTSAGTTGVSEATSPDTTSTDTTDTGPGAGAEPIVDPATAKAVASEADVMGKAAERDASGA